MSRFKVNARVVADLNLPAKLGQIEFTLLERPTFRECEYIERIAKQKYDDWSSLTHSKSVFFLSIRHVDHELVNWEQFNDLSPADFILLDDESADGDEDAEADPTGGAQPPP